MRKNITLIIMSFMILFSCSKDDSSDINTEAPNGTGGSLARFVLVDNYLYVIDNQKLMTYDVSSDAQPIHVNTQEVDFGIETLYPYEDFLLIGSTTGMFIYNIESNGVPSYISQFEHIETCDPVVTNGDYAYVTLRSNRTCGNGFSENNRLEIIDIQNPSSPSLVNQISLDNPKGLAIDGNSLFICTGESGIVVFDISNNTNPIQISTISGFTAHDVIVQDDRLLAVCTDGLRQFNLTDINNIEEISYLAVNF